MKRPWQIWSLYVLSLLVVVAAMIWLSWQSLSLEKARENDRIQTELARREAELQERVSSALWRMDGFLTNLIAREATRPWYLYQSFYTVASPPAQTAAASPYPEIPESPVASSEQQTANPQTSEPQNESCPSPFRLASPLLFQPSEFVKLHFEIDRQNLVSSPQTPQGADRSQAMVHGLSEAALQTNGRLADEVKFVCDFESMIACCSPELLPETPVMAGRQSELGRVPPPSGGMQAETMPLVGPDADTEFSFFQQLQRTLPPDSQVLDSQLASNLDQNGQDGNRSPRTKQVVQQARNQSRGASEYSQRQMNADAYAMTEWVGNNLIEPQMAGDIANSQLIREGVMQPFWMQDRLILARRVLKGEGEQIIQGCWLDWQRIQAALSDLVADLLPELDYQPVRDPDQMLLGQALATLPVQLVIDRPRMIAMLKLEASSADQQLAASLEQTSILQRALWIAWLGLAFAALAGAFLLHGVMRLSERRGAFVSAVSHELRTPLTTFRMYAEMMAEKMVPVDRQQQYAQTLKVEAERLSHLVENVLQFARLERSNQKSRLECVRLGELLDRFQDRLRDRATRCGAELVLAIADPVPDLKMKTDPGALEQILFNLVDNACKYARQAPDRRIILSGDLSSGDRLQLSVRDFGPGIRKQDRQHVFQPFRKSDMEAANTAPGVGLGLALCRRMAQSLGGRLTIEDAGDGQPGALLRLEIPLAS